MVRGGWEKVGIWRTDNGWILSPHFDFENPLSCVPLEVFTDWGELVAYLKEKVGPKEDGSPSR